MGRRHDDWSVHAKKQRNLRGRRPPWHARAPGDPGAGGRTHCSAPCRQKTPGGRARVPRGSPSLSSMRRPAIANRSFSLSKMSVGAG